MIHFDYFEPVTLREAYRLLARHGDEAKVMAGGTGLALLLKQELVQPAAVINISRIPELHRLEGNRRGGLRIGAAVTHTEVEVSPLVRQGYPILYETLHEVAQPRVRNMGTLGGNLCHADPMQDPPATLIALGASLVVGRAGGRRVLPVEEFFRDYYETALEPGELLLEIRLPAPGRGDGWSRVKWTPRSKQDYATVGVSALLRLDGRGRCRDARIGLNSVGPTAIRARQAEEALRGTRAGDEAFRAAGAAAAAEVDPSDDARGSADYKRKMVAVWVRRALEQARDRALAARAAA